MKINNKKSAFTMVEVIITLVIFSIIVVAYTASSLTLFKNTKAEFKDSKAMYASVDDLERVASKIKNLNLKSDYTGSTKIKKMKNKDYILSQYPDLNVNSTVNNIIEKIKDEPTINIDSLEKNPEFELFSGLYKCKINGYSISKNIHADNELTVDKCLYFIANSNEQKLKFPEYTAFILENDLTTFTLTKPKYLYFNNIKNTATAKKDIVGRYKITKETEPYAYYEKYDWEITKNRQNEDGDYFEPVCDIASGDIIEDSYNKEYPLDKKYFSSLTCYNKVLNIDETKVNPIRDFYLRFKVDPETATKVKVNPVYSDSVWVIGLPVTNELLYHYDMATNGGYIPPKNSSSDPDPKKDISGVAGLHGTFFPNKVIEPIRKTDPSSLSLELYKDNEYGKYIKLSNDNKEYTFKSVFDPRYRLTLFMVVDVSEASAGTIIERPANDIESQNAGSVEVSNFKIEYLGNSSGNEEFLFYSGREDKKHKTGVYFSTPSTSSGKHIIIADVFWVWRTEPYERFWTRFNIFAVDSLDFERRGHDNLDCSWNYAEARPSYEEKRLNRKNPIYLGGAEGLKVYEIIGYAESMLDPTYSTYDLSEVKPIYNYLKEKYQIN